MNSEQQELDQRRRYIGSEYVYVERPRCPGCESASLLTYHSHDQGDGSTLRYTQCRDCGRKFKIVVE